VAENISEAFAVQLLVLFLAWCPRVLTVTLPGSSRVWVRSRHGLGSNPSEQRVCGHPIQEAKSRACLENHPVLIGTENSSEHV